MRLKYFAHTLLSLLAATLVSAQDRAEIRVPVIKDHVRLLTGQEFSIGWNSESIYADGLIGGNPGEGVGWVEYEATLRGGWFINFYGALSDSNPGIASSYATVAGLTVGNRYTWEGDAWSPTLEVRAMYFGSGLPSLATSEGDVWGIGFRISSENEGSGLTPYLDFANYWEVSGDGSGNGTVVRAGFEGDWQVAERAGWAVEGALGHNFGWFGFDMTYLYAYVGPYFDLGRGWTLSIPEVTGVVELDGNGESLVCGGFTFSWS